MFIKVSDFEKALESRYRILGKLGEGAMGQVYRAVQLETGRPVAIKALARDLIADPKSLKRLEREAKSLSVLSHTGIVCVYEFDTVTADVPFLVMEFVPGRSLKQILKERQLKLKETLNLMAQAAKALSHAHVKGIIHRDVKPANMLIDEARMELKIVDFGIARKASNLTEQLTIEGEVFGSPLYMSPEQCQGNELDARSDIYSLGCVLFECLTGRPPFRGISAFDTMTMHLNEKPAALASLINLGAYGELDEIVGRCLEKNPENRYQQMSELASALAVLKETAAAALENTTGEEPKTAAFVQTPGASKENGGEPSKKSSRAAAVVIITILVICLGAAFFTLSKVSSTKETKLPPAQPEIKNRAQENPETNSQDANSQDAKGPASVENTAPPPVSQIGIPALPSHSNSSEKKPLDDESGKFSQTAPQGLLIEVKDETSNKE